MLNVSVDKAVILVLSSGFECIYSGEKMEAECTDLSPGKNYRVRVQCKSAGGKSDYSEVSTVTTEAVCPGVCHPPRLLGKPKASQLQLKWSECLVIAFTVVIIPP